MSCRRGNSNPYAETIGIDGCGFERFIDAGQNIAKIRHTKIAHVGRVKAYPGRNCREDSASDKISRRSERESEIALPGQAESTAALGPP